MESNRMEASTSAVGRLAIDDIIIIIIILISQRFFPVGFAQSVGRVLEASRVSVAWIPVGICQGALEKTIQYITNRMAFGSKISSNQIIQGECVRKQNFYGYVECKHIESLLTLRRRSEKLVRMTANVCSMYLLVERMTQDFVAGKCGLPTISMVKAHNTKLGREVVALCRETVGGNGIVLDFGIASK